MLNKIALSVEDVAESTGVGRNTWRTLIEEKKLPVRIVGRKHLIKVDTLNEFLLLNEGINLRDNDKVKSLK